MALLEDKLLSFSLLKEGDGDDVRHEDPDDGVHDDDIDNIDPDQFKRVAAEVEEEVREEAYRARKAADPLAERRHGPKAGPKGVLADKAWHDHLDMKARDREEMVRKDTWLRAGYGATAADGVKGSISVAAAPKSRRRDDDDDDGDDGAGAGGDGTGSSSSSSRASHAATSAGAKSATAAAKAGSDDEDDDDFFASYRAARIAQIKAAAAGPKFGSVRVLTSAADYVTAVDAVPPRAMCCVVLHEPFIPECRALVAALDAVAASVPQVCFMTLQSSLASETIDVVGLPAIIVYRGGETVNSFVRVQDDMGPKPTPDDVEAWLATVGIVAGERSGGAGTGGSGTSKL